MKKKAHMQDLEEKQNNLKVNISMIIDHHIIYSQIEIFL
jgi:hypothetical protein